MRNHTLKEKQEKLAQGLNWCAAHQAYEPINEFGVLNRNWTGLYHRCKESRKPRAKIDNAKNNPRNNKGLVGWKLLFNQGIYKITEISSGDIVYIGESDKIAHRNYEHMSGVKTGSKQFMNRPLTTEEQKLYKFEAWVNEPNALKRAMLESTLIRKFQPKYNKQYKNYTNE